ncbi:hypothetical protein ACVWW1_000448 [Bradyrhizobium sp. JR3.5]
MPITRKPLEIPPEVARQFAGKMRPSTVPLSGMRSRRISLGRRLCHDHVLHGARFLWLSVPPGRSTSLCLLPRRISDRAAPLASSPLVKRSQRDLKPRRYGAALARPKRNRPDYYHPSAKKSYRSSASRRSAERLTGFVHRLACRPSAWMRDRSRLASADTRPTCLGHGRNGQRCSGVSRSPRATGQPS